MWIYFKYDSPNPYYHSRIEKEKRLSTIIKNSKTVVNFTDVFNDPRFNKDTDRYVGMLIRSVLGVAVLKEKDACYGAIVAINKLAHEKFSSSDESYIAAFARYLMIFLEYQKMYDKQQYSVSIFHIIVQNEVVRMLTSIY